MKKYETSVILGWPTELDIDNKAIKKTSHPLMQRKGRQDLSYAIHYKDDGHLVTFAPTGSGKGVSVIIPNLLHYSGPAIVIDPKGENFAVTARYRQEVLKQKILLLDPFEAIDNDLLKKFDVTRNCLNPFDLGMLNDRGSEEDSQMIANMLSGEGTLGNDPFWDLSARRLISGIIAHELDKSKKENRKPKFSYLMDILFGENAIYNMALIIDVGDPTPFVSSCINGGFLSFGDDKLRTSILATAQSYLSTLMSKSLIYWLDESNLDIGQIQNSDDYTLYIVIPPNKLDSHSNLLATWIGVLMLSIMERKTPPSKRTLFMLDECANLGSLDVLKKAVTLLRGYGLQVWMFFQDLAQMKYLYDSDYLTMVNNCGVLQAFGSGRLAAAQPLASLIGKFTSSELTKLDRTQQVVSISPGKTRMVNLARYYKDGAFSGRFDENPLIKKGVKSVNKGTPNFKRVRRRFI
jgi:type IV secretion system protein VirD4